MVIKRNTQLEVAAIIGFSLSLYTKLKTAKCFIRINREGFVLIWSNFSRLFQEGIYLLLKCFPLWGIKPVTPIFNAFPGTNH